MNTSEQDKSTEQLADIQGIAERTRTVTVTERTVAKSDGETFQEVGKPTKVFVRPLPFRRWLTALSHVGNVLAHFPAGDFDLSNPQQLAVWIIQLLGACPDDVIGVACLATDKDADFFDRIDLDEGVKIILAVVEVNKDFFVQKVLPQLLEKAPEVSNVVAATFGQKA
jgi:hypothetical protein